MPHGKTAGALGAVLIVEDSHADALRAKRYLHEAGVEQARIEHVQTLEQAYEHLRARAVDLILLDLHLDGTPTLDEIARMRDTNPGAAILVVTGSAEDELSEEALSRGAQEYICKEDLTPRALQRAVRYAVNRQRYEREARQGLVARRVVRRLLADLTQQASGAAPRRELGKSLAAEVGPGPLAELLAQFRGLGAGELALVRQEGDRYLFTGREGIEVTPRASAPTCYIMLGYLEAAVGRAAGRTALGTEMQCQSQGHPECQFTVIARA